MKRCCKTESVTIPTKEYNTLRAHERAYLEERRMLHEAFIQEQQRDMESIIMSNIK